MPQRIGMRVGPEFERVEVLFSCAAGQEVPPALQPESAVLVEAQAGVGAVEFLLGDDESANDLRPGDRLQVVVAWLKARSVEVVGPRVLEHPPHRRTVTTATMWFSTNSQRTATEIPNCSAASVNRLVSVSAAKRCRCSGLSSGFDGTDATTNRRATRSTSRAP